MIAELLFSVTVLAGVPETIEEIKLEAPILIRADYELYDAITRTGQKQITDCPPVEGAVHLESDAIWLGTSIGDRRRIGADDWDALAAELRDYKGLPVFDGRTDLELSAASDVRAGRIARALAIARNSGFTRIEYTTRSWGRVRFFERDLDDQFPLRTVNRHSVAIASDGERAVVANDDGDVHLVDLAELEPLLRALRERSGRALSFARIDSFAMAAIAKTAGYIQADWDWVRSPLLVRPHLR